MSFRFAAPLVVAAVALTAAAAGLAAILQSPSSKRAASVPVPLCNASQLEARSGKGVRGTGNSWTYLYFTNIGSTCRLGGYPSLIGIKPSGQEVGLAVEHADNGVPMVPAELHRWALGKLVLWTNSMCSALGGVPALHPATVEAETYDGVIVLLPHGRGSVAGLNIDVACGLGESELGTTSPPG